MIRSHFLKTWPAEFAAIRAGLKSFEYRRDDRAFGFGEGDELRLLEFDPEAQDFTGEAEVRRVAYVLRGPAFGVPEGFAVLGFSAEAELERLRGLINSPELEDFGRGVQLEAAHQVERHGAAHDEGKGPLDWFWLIGFLAQKAAFAAIAGDMDKARHHCISTAAALANWHRALSGRPTAMRPGIASPFGEEAMDTRQLDQGSAP